MKSAKTKLYILMFGMIALTISGIALRTIALRVSFDAEIGYFQDGPLATLCYIITALAVLMPLVMSIIIPRRSHQSLPYSKRWVRIGECEG